MKILDAFRIEKNFFFVLEEKCDLVEGSCFDHNGYKFRIKEIIPGRLNRVGIRTCLVFNGCKENLTCSKNSEWSLNIFVV